MKIFVKNLRSLPYAFEFDADDGSVIRELLAPKDTPGDTVDIGLRVDPWELNRPKHARKLVSLFGGYPTMTLTPGGYLMSLPSGQISVRFQQEPDDLVFLFFGGGGGGGITLAQYKIDRPLSGVQDGVNRVFTTPEDFLPDTIEVFHNGDRLTKVGSVPEIAFEVSESGGVGTGYDTITFLTFKPKVKSTLRANYITP